LFFVFIFLSHSPSLPTLYIIDIMLAATRKAFTTIPNVASKATYATASQAVQISTAQNGIKVATVEDAGQTAGLSIIVNGGARLENGSNAGVAHFLKNYGFKVRCGLC
jgi:ubiquinol-cytochrome c reductase core subunit 2